MAMDATKRIEYGNILRSLIPQSGESIGNVTLRELLKEQAKKLGDELTDQDYWSLRDSLIDEGMIEQGRGRGGSVHLILSPPATPPSAAPSEPVVQKAAESTLYEPVLKAIVDGYVKENRIKRFISEITASQGRRATGGKWTRPDLTLIAVRTYQFTPGKRLEVITFEVKPDLDSAVEGVYEALAHSAFAHRAFLAIHLEGYGDKDDIPDERIVQECSRHGVGYLTFTDPSDYGTFEIVSSAKLNEPDPYDVDNFIRTQISQENQDQLREFLQ